MTDTILDGDPTEPQIIYPPNPTPTTAHFLVELPCGHIGWIDREQWRGDVSIDCTKPSEPMEGKECEYHETVDLSDQAPGAKR